MARRHQLPDENSPAESARLPGQVSRVEVQQRRSTRVNVYVDDRFSFACRAEVAQELGIRPGTEMTVALRTAALAEDAYYTAYESAIDLLAYRARSEQEIASRLRRKGYEPEVIERVLARLREQGYLDDRDFARFWIENRTANRPRGERALRQELREKGLDNQIVDDALEAAEIDQQAMAIEAAQKKARSLTGLEPEVQRRRLIGHLQRRGFSWEAIKPALEAVLRSENLDADFDTEPPDGV